MHICIEKMLDNAYLNLPPSKKSNINESDKCSWKLQKKAGLSRPY